MNRPKLHDLEIDLWEACNLKCAQCTHAAPFFTNKDQQYTFEQVQKDLTIIKKNIDITELRIVGGEPLMNKNIASFIKMMYEINSSERICLFTNGILLRDVDESMFQYLKKLRISVYPLSETLTKKVADNISYFIQKYPKMDIAANEINHFNKLHINEKIKDDALVKQIYQNCYYAYRKNGFSVFNGRLYKCFVSRKKYKYLDSNRHLIKDDFEYLKPNTHDSIELNDSLTVDEINKFINDDCPLEACKWCLGCSGQSFAHKQLTKGETDIATINDLNFESSKVYLSNLLLSWCLQTKDSGHLRDNIYFNTKFLKDYAKQFTTRDFRKESSEPSND